MVRLFVLISILLSSLLSLAQDKKGTINILSKEQKPDSLPVYNLEGKWQLEHHVIDRDTCNLTYIIDFKKDGSYYSVYYTPIQPKSVSGVWKVVGNRIHLTTKTSFVQTDGTTITDTYKIEYFFEGDEGLVMMEHLCSNLVMGISTLYKIQ